MDRRDFLAAAAAGTGAAVAAGTGAASGSRANAEGRIDELAFDSAASLLDADNRPLEDESVVAVWAGENARTTDADGNGDAVDYPDAADVPMVAVDGDVMGFGGMVADDGRNAQYGNEEFLLNAWDEHVGGGTVLFDEGHGQFYDLGKFATFESYAEDNGYTVEATTDLAADLPDANGLVVTSPSEGFSDAELDALKGFVEDGGALFLHDQSDFRNYDRTDNLDAIADHLGLAFRFNDDQVIDEVQNAAKKFKPVTDRFTATADPYVRDREGLGLDPSKTYTVQVKEVFDGDTVEVVFESGREESIRVLGVDTAEKKRNQRYEREQEWEGIERLDYLATWGANATEFAKSRLKPGDTIDVSFDDAEGVRDPFGRLLGYVEYDDGSGRRLYNRELIAEGQARVYGSGLSKHDAFQAVEKRARREGRGLWAESDPANSTPIRNRAVEELFLPTAASVRTSWGAVSPGRVPVFAAPEARQQFHDGDAGGGFWDWWDDDVAYDRIPLAAVDEDARVGMVGSPLIDESYEKSEDYPVDTAGYDNFTFLTNLIDYLADREGDVAIDGGHGQFGASYALSNEDAAYYQRYLEGVDIGFDQFNDLASADLSGYRAVVVTSPPEAFTWEEARALRSFAAAGGAVVLLGASTAVSEARENLNDIASALGSDLRLNGDEVLDDTNNVNDDPQVPTTGRFDRSFPLFSAYDAGGGGGGGCSKAVTDSFSGSLEAGGSTAFQYTTETADPCEVTVSLSGADGTDFDLYLTHDGRTPTPRDYDERSWNYGSDEEITVGTGDLSADATLGILVDAYSGSGEYTLTVEETGGT